MSRDQGRLMMAGIRERKRQHCSGVVTTHCFPLEICTKVFPFKIPLLFHIVCWSSGFWRSAFAINDSESDSEENHRRKDWADEEGPARVGTYLEY